MLFITFLVFLMYVLETLSVVCLLLVTTPSDGSSESKAERDKSVPERRTKELDGYVGFANLPNQVYRKAVKKGFEFTLMVVGKL